MTDDQSAPTVLDRLFAAGLSEERVEQHLTAGRVQVDSEPVTDPHQQAPPPVRIIITGL